MSRSLAVTTALALCAPAFLAAQLAPAPVPGPPVDPSLEFEAASIKPADASSPGARMMMMPGRLEMTNVPARMLLRPALRIQDYQVIGVPDWANADRYSIVAKAPDGAPPNAMPVMILNLLKDRFKLAIHTETREMPVLHLVVSRADGRLGASLKPTSPECQAGIGLRRGGPGPGPAGGPGGAGGPVAQGRGPLPPNPDFSQPVACGMMRIGPGLASGGGQPLAQLTQMLSQLTGRPVVDKTGLTGLYDFDLKFAPDQVQGGPLGPPPGAPPLAIDPDTPNIYTAVQEQLGLKLESQRGPVEVTIIDHMEKPTVD